MTTIRAQDARWVASLAAGWLLAFAAIVTAADAAFRLTLAVG